MREFVTTLWRWVEANAWVWIIAQLACSGAWAAIALYWYRRFVASEQRWTLKMAVKAERLTDDEIPSDIAIQRELCVRLALVDALPNLGPGEREALRREARAIHRVYYGRPR